MPNNLLGGNETVGDNSQHNSNVDEDFLTRERAALGDDADLFTSANDKTTSSNVQDEDLLGGDYNGDYNGGNRGGEEITEFESSFPSVDTQNEVMRQSKVPKT